MGYSQKRGCSFVASSLLLWRPSGAGSLDQTSAKSSSIASTQLLLGEAEHLALLLHVEATQPVGTVGPFAPDFIQWYLLLIHPLPWAAGIYGI